MMKRIVLFVVGTMAISTAALAQTADEAIERATAPAPRQARDGAMVIKWKPDHTYDVLGEGRIGGSATSSPGNRAGSRSLPSAPAWVTWTESLRTRSSKRWPTRLHGRPRWKPPRKTAHG